MDLTPAQLAEKLRAHLQLAPGESLYAVVDGAQDLELAYEAKCLYGKEIRSLFEGDMAPAAAAVGPYLVPIDPNSGYLENWARRWGKSGGIFLSTSVDSEQLWHHLRDVFVVQDEAGQEFFFRYYDPRVLRVFLANCTPEEARQCFGPVRRFFVEGSEPGTLVKYVVATNGLAMTSLNLSDSNLATTAPIPSA